IVGRKLPRPGSDIPWKRGMVASGIALLRGGVADVVFLRRIGGLAYSWQNLYIRTLITSGEGYLGLFYRTLLIFAALLAVYLLRYKRSKQWSVFAVFLVLAVGVILASTGGRSGTVRLILLSWLTYHFGVRKVSR